jgi:hypothetical protein
MKYKFHRRLKNKNKKMSGLNGKNICIKEIQEENTVRCRSYFSWCWLICNPDIFLYAFLYCASFSHMLISENNICLKNQKGTTKIRAFAMGILCNVISNFPALRQRN